MPDVFDQLTAEAPGDIFDQAAGETSSRDVFDRAEESARLDREMRDVRRQAGADAGALKQFDEATGLANKARAGVTRLLELPTTLQAAGVAGLDKPTVRQERRAFERAMSDPAYFAASTIPGATPLEVESRFGPPAKLDMAMQPQRELQKAISEDVAKIEAELSALPKSEAQKRLAAATSTGEKWTAWIRDPVELTAGIVLESLPASLVGAGVGGMAGGTVGMAAGVGASSASMTFASELLGNAAALGYDVRDPDRLQAWLNNSEDFQAAFRQAAVKSAVVGGVDAGTAGIAGQFIEPALKQGLKQIVIAGGKEAGVQMAGGAGGELAGSLAAGQTPDVFDVAMEGIAEIASAPGEVAGNLQAKREDVSISSPSKEVEKSDTPHKPAVTRDLAAELQSAMTGNQIAASPKPEVQSLKPEAAADRDIFDRAMEDLPADAQAEIEARLTAEAVGETTVPGAAAGTVTGQNEGKASDATAGDIAAEQMPAEVLPTATQSGNARTPTAPVTETAETLQAAPTSPKPGKRFFLRPRADGVPDILDAIQELGGIKPPGDFSGGEYDGFREAMTGAARLLINRSSKHSPDTLIQELKAIGAVGAERLESANELWPAIQAAVKGRDKLRITDRGQREEAKQSVEFDKRAIQGKRPKETGKFTAVPVKAMLQADEFEVQGFKFEVKHLEFDPDGNLVFVEVKDGPKFGVQRVDGDEFIHVDNQSFAAGPQHAELPSAIPDKAHKPGGEGQPRSEAKEQRNTLREGFEFDAAESVQDQRARQAREKQQEAERKAREQMRERAAARLTGEDLDTTTEMFGGADARETRTDKTGQGSLFERPQQYRVDEKTLEAVSSSYGIPPEATAEKLQEGKPYQTEFDLSAAQAEGATLGRSAGGAHPLTSFRAADFSREFSASSTVSSIDQAKAPPAVPTYNVNGTVILTSADFVNTLLAVRSPNNESLKVVILEKQTGKVIHSEVLYAGTLDTIAADTKDFLRLYAKHGQQGTHMLISHNHPSGNPTPSDADRKFTSKLQLAARAAGFEVVDHIITNGDRYYSLRLDRMEAVENPQLAPWENLPRSVLGYVQSPTEFENLVKNLRQSNQSVSHIIYQNTRSQVTAIERVSPDGETVRRALLNGIGREAASLVLLDYGPKVDKSDAYHWTRLIQRDLVGTSTRVVDFAANGVMSGMSEGLMTATGGFLGEPRGDLRDARDLTQEISTAEAELKAAIRQYMDPPKGMSKREAREARDAAAAKLRELQRKRLQEMMSVHVDHLRGDPQELARHISETVDLLNSVLDEISELKATSQAVPSTLNKFRNDLQTRLMALKGWADDRTDEAVPGGARQRGGPAAGSSNRQKELEFEGATNPERKTLSDWWSDVRSFFRKFASPVPEIPLTGPEAVAAAPFLRGFRLFRAETARVRREAAAKIQHVLEPLLAGEDAGAPGRTREQNAALKRYHQLSNQLTRARAQGRDDLAARIAADMEKLEETSLRSDPFNVFRLLVLYRDLWWRGTYLKTPEGKPVSLPQGFTIEEVANRLQRLEALRKDHPQQAAITESLRRHYALTDELQKSIMEHGEIIPEALRNPLYFPHHILDYWTGRIDRVRPSTEEDFRRYLIAPMGSGKLIQTDYLKAMYLHTADVLAHNARVDLVQKYWQRYDVSERLKEEFGEAWDKPWNLPPGYKLFAPFKKLPLRMDYVLTREVLADKLGVLFNDGDLRQRAGEAGRVLKVKPEDLHAAMVAGEKIKWAIPEEIADALEGIAKRERARANPGVAHAAGLPVRTLVNFWKKVKLFAPWSWPRYEYGNTMTDVIDKLLVADPGMAKFIPQAAREILNAARTGEKSSEFIAGSREGVFETITGAEIGDARKLVELPEFNALATMGENAAGMVRKFAHLTARMSMFREAAFRYAKFLADVDRMKRGELPVYAGAYHESIEALGEEPIGQRPLLEGEDLVHAKAAEISLKTFGDYNSLSVVGQWLRQYLIPFHSWTEVNFKYHANQLRNIADGLRGIRGGSRRDVALKYAAVRVISLLTGVAVVQALWNSVGGAMAGLWDDDEDLESQLSAHDRRRAHLILGKDENGEVRVAYTPSAFGDVAEWIGGNNAKRLFLEYAKGDITLQQFISDYAKQLPADTLNKLVQSTGPAVKGPYELASGKAVFPDVLDQRTIPKSDRWWRFAGTMVDDRAVNWIRQVFDKDYYAPGMNEQIQQIILQVRRRDPEQWSYYEAREKAADWKEQQTGKRFEAGSYDAPEAQVLRNFRRAIYRGDVAAAEQFYRRLLEFGYTSERFDASIRAQHPLSDLNREQRRDYESGLDARSRRELELALEYYERIAAFDRRERGLFPRARAVQRGTAVRAPNTELLRELMQK